MQVRKHFLISILAINEIDFEKEVSIIISSRHILSEPITLIKVQYWALGHHIIEKYKICPPRHITSAAIFVDTFQRYINISDCCYLAVTFYWSIVSVAGWPIQISSQRTFYFVHQIGKFRTMQERSVSNPVCLLCKVAKYEYIL